MSVKKPFVVRIELEFEDVVLAENATEAENVLAKRCEADIGYAVDQLYHTSGNVSFHAEEVTDKEIPEQVIEDIIDKNKKDSSYNKIIDFIEEIMDKEIDEELLYKGSPISDLKSKLAGISGKSITKD